MAQRAEAPISSERCCKRAPCDLHSSSLVKVSTYDNELCAVPPRAKTKRVAPGWKAQGNLHCITTEGS